MGRCSSTILTITVCNGDHLHHLEVEHLEATYDLAGVLENKYLRGVVVDEIVNGFAYHSADENDWTNYTFHHDHLNSVSALTGHNGSVEETTSFDAFGAPLTQAIPGTGNTLLYTGREYDEDTGLYYYRARYYDPQIGRFISEDPLGFEGGYNFYAYVDNNPINYNDPTGRCPWCLAAVVPVLETMGIGAATSVATGAAIRGGAAAYQGGDVSSAVFDTDAILLDAGLGAIGGGIASGAKAYHVSRLPISTKGEMGEALFRSQLDNVGATYAEQMAVRTGQGKQYTRLDFGVPKGGDIAGFEIKTFSSKLSPNQIALQNTINGGGYGLTFGSRARAAGLSGRNVTSLDEIRYGAYDFVSPGYSIFGGGLLGGTYNSSSNAGGGFVLYPSKPNTNTIQSVYKK